MKEEASSPDKMILLEKVSKPKTPTSDPDLIKSVWPNLGGKILIKEICWIDFFKMFHDRIRYLRKCLQFPGVIHFTISVKLSAVVCVYSLIIVLMIQVDVFLITFLLNHRMPEFLITGTKGFIYLYQA